MVKDTPRGKKRNYDAKDDDDTHDDDDGVVKPVSKRPKRAKKEPLQEMDVDDTAINGKDQKSHNIARTTTTEDQHKKKKEEEEEEDEARNRKMNTRREVKSTVDHVSTPSKTPVTPKREREAAPSPESEAEQNSEVTEKQQQKSKQNTDSNLTPRSSGRMRGGGGGGRTRVRGNAITSSPPEVKSEPPSPPLHAPPPPAVVHPEVKSGSVPEALPKIEKEEPESAPHSQSSQGTSTGRGRRKSTQGDENSTKSPRRG